MIALEQFDIDVKLFCVRLFPTVVKILRFLKRTRDWGNFLVTRPHRDV